MGDITIFNRLRDGIRARPRMRSLFLVAPVLLPLVLFTVTDLRGVDFGYHWDEVGWQVRPVRDMVASGSLMPPAAIYPAVAKWLVLLPTVPVAMRAIAAAGRTPRTVQAAMVAAMDAPGYLLTVRCVFIVVSALAILWVYLAALALRRSWWEAFVASACLAFSWEYAYHARWVATDCIAVQFSALALLMLALFHRSGAAKPRWLYAAAVAAGLATGSKYPCVFVLVPVMLSSVLTLPLRPVRAQLTRLVAVVGITVVVYLVTTPATLFDPFNFIEKSQWITAAYKKGHVASHAARSVWHHWELVLIYLSLAYFSPYPALSLALFAGVVGGAIVWLRDDRRVGAVLLSLPVVFLLVFCFRILGVVVRNYLFLVPFLALLAARGIAEAARLLPFRWARWSFAAAVAFAFLLEAVWLVRAGESIRHFDPMSQVRSAVAYVGDHDKTQFRLSHQVRELAAQQHLQLPPNVTEGPDAAMVVFFARAEGPSQYDWKTNDFWLTKAVFGTREVNISWYGGWIGRDRVVVMTMEKAKAAQIELAR